MASGDLGVLSSAQAIAFEETSGTTSGTKLVPYTAESLIAFRAAVLPWLAELLRRRPGVAHGRAYVSISPILRPPRVTRGGIPIGQGSDAAYLGADLADAFVSTLAVAPDVAASPTFEAWRLATLTQLLEAYDLAFVSVWSPTFWLELVDAIPSLVASLAPQLSQPARRRLEASLRGPKLETKILWPNLACISCWTDASSAIYADRLRVQFPGVPVEGKGLLATEAAMTVPFRDADGGVPAILSTFVEFVDDSGTPHLCDSLEVGRTYRVVVTTAGGFYRYDIGDRVDCIAVNDRVPQLRFVGRHGVHSDLVGEKIDEGFAAEIIRQLGVVATLAAHKGAPASGIKPHYELWLNHDVADVAALAAKAERLLSANPQYAYAKSVGQLGALLLSIRVNHIEQRSQRLMMSGRRLGDVKPVSLVTDAMGGEFERCASR